MDKPFSQSSYAALPSRNLTWNRGIKLNNSVRLFHTVSGSKRFTNLNIAYPVRLKVRHKSRGRYLRVSYFKGNAQNGEHGDQSSKSNIQNSVGISYIPQDTNSMKLKDVSISSASQSNDIMPSSQAIHQLFRHWLTLLWADSEPQIGEEIVETPKKDLLHPQTGIDVKKRGEVLQVVLRYILGLDAPVKIPLLIFAPLYVAVNLVYGSEVSKELAPLWIIGPLFAAMYVKLIQGLVAFYLFSFRQGVKLWKDLPRYYDMVYQYLANGKLKEGVRAQFWQSMGNRKDLDYKEDSKRKWEAYEDWLEELSSWFSQLTWPLRYRVVKILKRAKLI